MMQIVDRVLSNAKNIPGWRTNRKILVIESDDWGSIRMPGGQVLHEVLKHFPKMANNDFYRYDTLATRQDIDDLFNVLQSVTDKTGKSAVMTPFCNVANPDFDKIKLSDYQSYFYEPFTLTLERYYPGQNVYEKWREGIKAQIWAPEYHGREHINVPKWIKLLSSGDSDALFFFDLKIAHFPFRNPLNSHFQSLAPTYYYDQTDEIEILERALNDGINVFKNIFGYTPVSFCPPNAIFSRQLENSLKQSTLRAIVVERNRFEPSTTGKIEQQNYLFKYGKGNGGGQIYYRRNVKFEPIQKNFSLDKVKQDIDAAFRWGKPAVISTHRINYVSGVTDDQKSRSLNLLKQLLLETKNKWGDIEFMSSSSLVNIINK